MVLKGSHILFKKNVPLVNTYNFSAWAIEKQIEDGYGSTRKPVHTFFFLLVCILLCRETDVSRFDGEALQFIQQLLAKNLNASYKF